ncbi:hypothetical protein Tco_0318345 [Tanacetum coccineum]
MQNCSFFVFFKFILHILHLSEVSHGEVSHGVEKNGVLLQVMDVLVMVGLEDGLGEVSGEGEGEDVIREGEVEGSVTSSIVGNRATSWPENPDGRPSSIREIVSINVNNSIHEIVPIIQQLVLDPENLSTTTCSSHIFSFVVRSVATTLSIVTISLRDGCLWRNLQTLHIAHYYKHDIRPRLLYGTSRAINRSIKDVITSAHFLLELKAFPKYVGVEVRFTSELLEIFSISHIPDFILTVKMPFVSVGSVIPKSASSTIFGDSITKIMKPSSNLAVQSNLDLAEKMC